MTDPQGAWVEVVYFHLTASEIARGAADAVKWEREATAEWKRAKAAGEVTATRDIVQMALWRLLSNSNWMPGSVRSARRVEVRIAIEMDSEIEGVRRRARAHLADQITRTRADLQRLEAQLVDEAEDA